MARVCNLVVLMDKTNISVKELAIKTKISEDRIRILIREPEEPKRWEAEAISEALDIEIRSIWPQLVID